MVYGLPAHAPNQQQHQRSNAADICWAVYSVVELNDRKLKQLEHCLNDPDGLATESKLAPRCSFHGSSLKEVYDYHLWLRDQDRCYHPLYFVVADSTEYQRDGVLIVNLNCFSHGKDNEVDVGRCGIDMACLWLINLDIGNQDWMDLKEEEHANWGGEDPYPAASIESVPAVSHKYHWYGTTNKAATVASLLDPNYTKAEQRDQKFTGFGGYGQYSNPLDKIRRMHLRRCKAAKNGFHPTLFVWADNENPEEPEGVSIVKLHWSGDLDHVTDDEINKVVPEIEIIVKVPASRAWDVMEEIVQRDS